MITISELEGRLGQELGVSAWREVTQADIDAFAHVTGDHQFIHVHEARARAETDFGGTIAHGFLTLSLLSAFALDALPPLSGRRMGVNYGFERVRFLSPVRTGARVRGRFTLARLEPRRTNEFLLGYDVTVEIEGSEKPALAALWLTLAVVGE
ncbi:MaoC family dehydratase [Enterovirga aerilata]|uniref:MaoC family dehydratase n=1 Tax=Enterovirga aerilata TaxID=2730920 RepID=A0A849IE32_9HYPH|nr:MaoC family dehydratase [Enterovirga sp. DB1703]NNM74709.1 MaoC family dehydratase [Enterovirga sp. DB1703]